MSAVTDKLAPFRKKGDAPAEQAKPASNKQPYQPFGLSDTEKRHLEIRLKFPKSAECPSYFTLTNVRGEWRMGQGITLKYGNTMVVDIEGRNLTELFRGLRDWKAEFIAEFDPQEHLEPVDQKAPFISSITIYTTRPEDPPPVNQRH
jgi:hypothetical protein